jgi:hypothetical protein
MVWRGLAAVSLLEFDSLQFWIEELSDDPYSTGRYRMAGLAVSEHRELLEDGPTGLLCPTLISFRIINGVPRFVSGSN